MSITVFFIMYKPSDKTRIINNIFESCKNVGKSVKIKGKYLNIEKLLSAGVTMQTRRWRLNFNYMMYDPTYKFETRRSRRYSWLHHCNYNSSIAFSMSPKIASFNLSKLLLHILLSIDLRPSDLATVVSNGETGVTCINWSDKLSFNGNRNTPKIFNNIHLWGIGLSRNLKVTSKSLTRLTFPNDYFYP